MFDPSCPSRDEALKGYSVLFPSKLNTQEFLFCAMKTHAINISLLQHSHLKPDTLDQKGGILWADSYSPVSSKSARLRHYHDASDHNGMNDRQIYHC